MVELTYGAAPLWVGLLSAVILFQIVWVFAYLNKRNDYADVAWGPGFAVSAWASYIWACLIEGRPFLDLRTLLMCLLISAWGFRLFAYIGVRNLGKKNEDPRYLKWRQEWGTTWVWRSYLQIFVLQGLILFIINLTVLWAIARAPEPVDVFVFLGVLIWAIGFFFEVLGDKQLRVFTKNPQNKGKLIKQGLWQYSRHPNYFGEVVQWWGLYLMVLPLHGGWVTIISPLAITFLILKVSGVPLLEEQMKSRPGFAQYQRQVSKFFPWFPQK